MKAGSTRRTAVSIKIAVALLMVAVVTFSVFLYERKLLVSTIKDLPIATALSRLLTEEIVYTRNDQPLQPASDGALLVGSQTIPNQELFSATNIGLNPVSPGSPNYATYLGTQNLIISEQILRLMSEINEGFYNQILKQADAIYDSARRGRENLDLGLRIDNAPAGSLIFASENDVLNGLPIGSDGQLLVIDNGLPTWQNSSNVPTISGGELIVGNVTATSTTDTSTFAHSISIASDAQYRIGGVGILSRQANGAILGGDLSGNARGDNAIDMQSARGLDTQVASGKFSVSFGNYNTASGYNSNAFGNLNTSSGYYSFAGGIGNIASNDFTVALGYNNRATASNASAFGSNITNNIANSAMIGPSDSAKLTILDTGETQANFFTATSTSATSTFAHSISIASDAQYRIGGVGILSRQSNGAILGGDVSGDIRGVDALDIQGFRGLPTQVASGVFSLAIGHANTASAAYNTAAGYGNTASADYAQAFGYANDATGDGSVAIGINNTASAYDALAFGTGVVNNVASSLMIGPNNSAKLTILDSGNVGIGTTTPSAQLTTTGSVRFATFGAGDLQTDANGNLLVSSDERLKEIVDEYQATSSVQQLLGITPIQYRWTLDSGFDTSRIYTGFSAQNVQEFIPEAVGEDSQGFLTLSERPIIATIVNAIKEIWARITLQQEQIDELREDNERLQGELEQLREELNVDDNSNSSPLSTEPEPEQTVPEETTGSHGEQEADSQPLQTGEPSTDAGTESSDNSSEIIVDGGSGEVPEAAGE